MNHPTQRERDYTPSNWAEFGIKSGVVGRAAKGFLTEQSGTTGSNSYLSPGARATDPGRREAFLRRKSDLLEQGGGSRPELSREGKNGLSGSCKSLTDMWEKQLNCPTVVKHSSPAFQASGQNMEERKRYLQEQFNQENKPSLKRSDGDGEGGVIQAGTVGTIKKELFESSHNEFARSFVPPPVEAHGAASSKFQAALQGLSGGGGIPQRGPVQRSKSCTSMQPLWDNLLNENANPREAPKFIGGAAVGMGQVGKSRHSFEFEFPTKTFQVSGVLSRLKATEAAHVRKGDRGRHDDELDMVRASRSRRQFGNDLQGERSGGFDGQQGIRLELEALRMNRRFMMQEEEDEVEEETKLSERDRIQGRQAGLRWKEENIKISTRKIC